MTEKKIKRTEVRKVKNPVLKKNVIIPGLAAVLLAAVLIIPAVWVGGEKLPTPPRDEVPSIPDVSPVPISDREFNGVPPEKIRFDQTYSSGNLNEVYLQ